MWAKVEDNQIVEVYANPRDLTVRRVLQRAVKGEGDKLVIEEYEADVNVPQTVFSNQGLLAELNIFPVRVVNVNSPEDTVGWDFTQELTFQGDHIVETRTWFDTPEGPQKRIDRDIFMEYKRRRAALAHVRNLTTAYMIENDVLFESDLTAEDKAAIRAEALGGGRAN